MGGVKFKLQPPHFDALLLSLPEKFIKELQEQLKIWEGKGMIAVSELRKLAGRVAWLAGVLVRARWTTPMFCRARKSLAGPFLGGGDGAPGTEVHTQARAGDGQDPDRRFTHGTGGHLGLERQGHEGTGVAGDTKMLASSPLTWAPQPLRPSLKRWSSSWP